MTPKKKVTPKRSRVVKRAKAWIVMSSELGEGGVIVSVHGSLNGANVAALHRMGGLTDPAWRQMRVEHPQIAAWRNGADEVSVEQWEVEP